MPRGTLEACVPRSRVLRKDRLYPGGPTSRGTLEACVPRLLVLREDPLYSRAASAEMARWKRRTQVPVEVNQ